METKEQKNLLLLLTAVCVYYLIAFITYAASDLTAWQLSIRESISERMVRSRMNTPDDYDILLQGDVEDRIAERYPWLAIADTFVKSVSVVRAAFEFVLPVGVGLVAIVVLAFKIAP